VDFESVRIDEENRQTLMLKNKGRFDIGYTWVPLTPVSSIQFRLLERWAYDREVVGFTHRQVAVKWLLFTVCGLVSLIHLGTVYNQHQRQLSLLSVCGMQIEYRPIWLGLRLRSHKHEYEFGAVRVPVYGFRQTRVCMYFNGGRSHTYEYGLPVNFTRTSSFCAGHVFIQLVETKLLVNSIDIIYKSRGAYLTSELSSS